MYNTGAGAGPGAGEADETMVNQITMDVVQLPIQLFVESQFRVIQSKTCIDAPLLVHLLGRLRRFASRLVHRLQSSRRWLE